MLTTLQAAAVRGVEPATIRAWVLRGKLLPRGASPTRGRSTMLFDAAEVMAVEHKPLGRRGKNPPAAPPPPAPLPVVEPVSMMLPAGIRVLQRLGRFRKVNPTHFEARPRGGAVLLGRVLIGTDWLRVYRSESGVVYHELADWMAEDADWMESKDNAETAVLLGYAKEAA